MLSMNVPPLIQAVLRFIKTSLLYHCRESIEPVYSLLRDPVDGDLPQYLVMEAQLPGIVSQSPNL